MSKERRLRRNEVLRRPAVIAAIGVVLVVVAAGGALAVVRWGQNASALRPQPLAASPTVAATASPSPSPVHKTVRATPLRQNDCGPSPHACGFPDATNTGVPLGVTLRSVPGQVSQGPGWSSDSAGNVTVYGEGAVFAGFSVHGVVNVTASGVIVKDDAISNWGNDTSGDGVNLTGNPSNVTIENNDISSPYGTRGNNGLFAGIKDITGTARGTRVLNNNIADASTGIQLYIGLIEGNYVHDITPASPDSHLNGTTSNGSTIPLTIQHNTVFNPNGQTDAVSLFEDFGVEANVVINDNLLAGGGYAIYGGQNSGGPQAYNIRITNNRFSTIYYPQCGYYGYIAAFDSSAPGNTWSGNVWDTTGAPVSS
jgi:hypothetical protein